MNTHRATADKKSVFAWVLFDFANSAYTTLIVTFIYSTYFVKAIAPDEITGTALWSRGVTITAIIVALLSPLLGALADQNNRRKTFLAISTVTAIFGSAALYFISPGRTILALVWFVLSNIAFEFTNVFYNAYLPEIAPPDKIGRISGLGWGVGYIGGLLAMLIAMIGFINPDIPWFGFVKENGENIRATNLLVAAWFGVFALPMLILVKTKATASSALGGGVIKKGLLELWATFQEVRKFREIVKFLIARLVYNDGLVTIFAFGGIYAAGTFGMSYKEIMLFGIVLNIAAGIGALAMGYLDDKIGGKRTIQMSNLVLAFASLIAVIAPSKTLFWVAAILIGLFAGPNQSASRSMLGRFVPKEKETQFFGFFAFSGKLTAFFGPLLLGVLTDVFNSQRVGVSTVVLFFLVGMLLLALVDEKTGITAASSDR